MYGEELLNVFAVFLCFYVLLNRISGFQTICWTKQDTLRHHPWLWKITIVLFPLFSDILKTEKSINWKVIDRLTARENKSEL